MSQDHYEQVLPIQQVLMGLVNHEVTVRRIGSAWHCRVFVNGVLNQEARCWNRISIGYTCRNLLRWEDKCGNISSYATAARERLNKGWQLQW